MKSEAISRTGIVDALGTGLTEASRRPWLWIVPIVVDLTLWLAPRLSITALTTRLFASWRDMLPMIYTPEQMAGAREGIDLLQTNLLDVVKSVNLGGMLTAGWLAPPSALVPAQATRYLMISDAVLAPVTLAVQVKPLAPSSWQTSFELGSVFSVLAVVLILWVISQFLTTLYFLMIATRLPTATRDGSKGVNGWLKLAGAFALLSVFASFGAFMLRLPLALVYALALFSGSGAAGLLFVIGGGITLWLTMWYLSTLYFVGDALAFDRLPLWPGFMQSLILVRSNGFRVLGLIAVVNVLMLGARAIWGFMGSNPAGALLAIVLNGYLATAMTIGIFVYYRGLRRQWQSAQLGRQLSK